jgi:hemerythrin-like domain-containing protein
VQFPLTGIAWDAWNAKDAKRNPAREAAMESKMKQQAKPNVGASLLAVHSVISRGLEVARGSAREQEGVAPGDARQGYADFLHSLSSFLHGHHLTEDDLVFPYFKKLIPDEPFDKLSADHKKMEPLIRALDEGGDFWKAGDDERMAEITAALDSLREIWYPHIKIEEGFYNPEKLDKLLPAEEHVRLIQQFSQYSMENSGPDYLIVPFFLFSLPPELRARIAAMLPPVVIEELVPVTWKDRWAPMKPFLLD